MKILASGALWDLIVGDDFHGGSVFFGFPSASTTLRCSFVRYTLRVALSVYSISLKFPVTNGSNRIILRLELVGLRLILEFVYAKRGRYGNT